MADRRDQMREGDIPASLMGRLSRDCVVRPSVSLVPMRKGTSGGIRSKELVQDTEWVAPYKREILMHSAVRKPVVEDGLLHVVHGGDIGYPQPHVVVGACAEARVKAANGVQDLAPDHFAIDGGPLPLGSELFYEEGKRVLVIQLPRDATPPRAGASISVSDVADHFGNSIEPNPSVVALPYE